VDQAGHLVFAGRTGVKAGADNQVLAATAVGGTTRTAQRLTLPKDVVDVIRRAPVHVEVAYWLTLFRLETTDRIAAVGGDNRVRGFGWCRTTARTPRSSIPTR
jgi:hypothetical protein